MFPPIILLHDLNLSVKSWMVLRPLSTSQVVPIPLKLSPSFWILLSTATTLPDSIDWNTPFRSSPSSIWVILLLKAFSMFPQSFWPLVIWRRFDLNISTSLNFSVNCDSSNLDLPCATANGASLATISSLICWMIWLVAAKPISIV